jgi:hypothetical protein
LDWVWNYYENGELLKVVDSRLGNNFNEEQMTKVLLLGLLCSHPDANARPLMGYVRQVLVANASLPPPSPCKTNLHFTRVDCIPGFA